MPLCVLRVHPITGAGLWRVLVVAAGKACPAIVAAWVVLVVHLGWAGELAAVDESPSVTSTAAVAAVDSAPMIRQENGIQVRPGFRVDQIYKVPKAEEGSWINFTFDDRGRMIVSSENGKLYRLTLSESGPPQVEPLDVDVDTVHGLLVVDGALYLGLNPSKRERVREPGLYRLTDTDGDDQYDRVEHLLSYEGGGEHGPHAVILAPDGESLFICAGNATDRPELVRSRVPLRWEEDLLLPRMWDANGHMAGRSVLGGWVGRCDLDGGNFELVCTGFRNEFDLALNQDGDLFTFDADMEWDVGASWYRPTRVCHVISGGEFGWRSGAGKWPEYYFDSLTPVVDVGVGSPTGIAFAYGAKFPARYQRALLISDWSYGVIYATHLTPDGSTYQGRLERFVAGPLQVTDVAVNHDDGNVYFTVGGRNTESAVYRISYVGQESTQPIGADDPADTPHTIASRQVRRQLESLHHAGAPDAVAIAWPHLGDPDRHLRFAARIAIEHQPVESWQDRALAEREPVARLNALVGLARCGDPQLRGQIVAAVVALAREAGDVTNRTRDQWLDICRVLEVTFSRMGPPPPLAREAAIDAINSHFPSGHRLVDRELAELLIYLEAPGVIDNTLGLLNDSYTQQDQLHYAYSLRSLTSGWTLAQRRRYLDWFHTAGAHRGGASFDKYLNKIRGEFIGNIPEEVRQELQAEIDNVPRTVAPEAVLESRQQVQEWKLAELLPVVDTATGARDFARGRKMFAVAQCFRCHRVRGEGESIGPDLTGVGRRFGNRDLLTAMVLPNETISDQYAQTTFVTSGRVITGRVVNSGGGRIQVVTDMFEQDRQESIPQAEIEESYPARVSAMPSGLLNTLELEEILDLIADLKSGGDPQHEIYRRTGPAAN